MNKIKSLLFHNKKITIGLIIVLAISLPLVINQVLKQQDIRQRASTTSEIKFSFDKPIITIAKNDSIDVDTLVNTAGYDLGSIRMKITYDPAKLLFEKVTLPTGLVEIKKTVSETNGIVQETKGLVDLIFINPLDTPKLQGTAVTLVTFQFKTKVAGTTEVKYVLNEMEATASQQSEFVSINPDTVKTVVNITPTTNTRFGFWCGSNKNGYGEIGTIPGTIKQVQEWNNTGQNWKMWIRDQAAANSTLQALTSGKYYSFSIEEGVTTPPEICEKYPTVTTPSTTNTLTLTRGDNGYTWCGARMNLKDTTTNKLPTYIAHVNKWNNITSKFDFWYGSGFPDSFSTLDELIPGNYYFFKVTATGTSFPLEVTGGNLCNPDGFSQTTPPTATSVPPTTISCPTGTTTTQALKSKGDANCDSIITPVDFNIWLSEYVAKQENTTGRSRYSDFNIPLNDIGTEDFSIWLYTYTQEQGL